MRIWSLHPKYMDAKGLLALWRESLLAKHVLEGRTEGYKNHPQLIRFKKSENPVDSINQYLSYVYKESLIRGFNFNRNKISWDFNSTTLSVTSEQLKYETSHLIKKIKLRDTLKYTELINETNIVTHPLFEVVDGNIEKWEIVRQ